LDDERKQDELVVYFEDLIIEENCRIDNIGTLK